MEYSYQHKHPIPEDENVRKYQQKMNSIREVFHGPWLPLETDGKFGRKTEEAVKQMQSFLGLSPSGVLNESTQRALDAKYIESQQTYCRPSTAKPTNYQFASANYTVAPTGEYAEMLKNQVEANSNWVWDSSWTAYTGAFINLIGIIASSFEDELLKLLKNGSVTDEEALRALRRVVGRYESQAKKYQEGFAKLCQALDKRLEEIATKKYLHNAIQSGDAPRFYIDPQGRKVNVQSLAEMPYNPNVTKTLKKESEVAFKKVLGSFKNVAKKGVGKLNYLVHVCCIIYWGHKWSHADNPKDAEVYKACMCESVSNLVSDAVFDASIGLAVGGIAAAVGGVAGGAIAVTFALLDLVIVPLTGKSCSAWFMEGQMNYNNLVHETWKPKQGDTYWQESMKNVGRARSFMMH